MEINTRSFVVIFLILLFDLLAFTIILPLFPSIIDHYNTINKDGESSDAWLEYIHKLLEWFRKTLMMPDERRYNNVLIGGILGSLFSFLQFLSSPIVGACSDIFGRKKVLLLTMFGTTLSYIIWWKAVTFKLFILSRIIGGLAKGSVLLCTTMMSDITTKENRGKGMVFVGLSFSLAFISGPLIGAYFASQHRDKLAESFEKPAIVSIGFQLVSIFITVFFLKDTLLSKLSISDGLKKVIKLVNPFSLFNFSSSKECGSFLRQLAVVNFLYLLFFSGLEFTLTFVTHERFNFTSMQQGKLLFFSGVVMVIVQGGYVRRIKLNKEKNAIVQGIAIIIPSMLLISMTFSVTVMYFALFLYSFAAGTVVPLLTTLFTQYSSDNDNGENIGKFRSIGALSRAIAPFLTCFVYWRFGSTICYIIGAAMFFFPLYLIFKVEVCKVDKDQ
ncbi:major facilitator superfamily domain-containing protein 10 isoform X2 [Hydra vulgaris]|uniref:Major facilitator superfamily domain-containing protein 10 isoform X2 n=1 Tax=Hydra vulgaris TaxID=6087 RepID=A0ABM4BKN4_HYDVU